MKSKFISTGLASAGRYRQAEKTADTTPLAAQILPPVNPPPDTTAVKTDLDALVRKEQAKLHGELLEKERAEFHKHRQTLLPELRETITGQQAARQTLENQLVTLLRVHADLEAASLSADGTVTLTEVREAKRYLEAARMELLKLQRTQASAPLAYPATVPGTGFAPAHLAQLSFQQATRLGLMLAWPLLATILLGALFIGICLLSVFKG